MNHNLNYLFVYGTFVPAENSLNAQPSPNRQRQRQYITTNTIIMKVEAQITISGNKTEVWATITSINDFQKILSGVERIEILTEPANGLVGLKWRETRMYFGKPAAIDKWITDAVGDEFYKTRAEMDGFIFLTTMTISENGSGTRLTSTHETKSKSIIAKLKSLPMIFFRGLLKKTILQDLTEIKIAVERK